AGLRGGEIRARPGDAGATGLAGDDSSKRGAVLGLAAALLAGDCAHPRGRNRRGGRGAGAGGVGGDGAGDGAAWTWSESLSGSRRSSRPGGTAPSISSQSSRGGEQCGHRRLIVLPPRF